MLVGWAFFVGVLRELSGRLCVSWLSGRLFVNCVGVCFCVSRHVRISSFQCMFV